MFRQHGHHRLAMFGAIVLSLAVAGQAFAHTWSARIPLTSSGSGFGHVVGLNSTTAVAAYVEWNGNGYDVKTRRSATSGASWDAPITLSTNGYPSDIAGLDPYVDVVWAQNHRVRYARSDDGGMTFDPSIALTASTFPINLSVARGPAGLVAVAWQNGSTNTIKVRVSTNGGVSFGATTAFPSHVQDMGTSVAAGDGVVYLAYKTRYYRLLVRRSTNGGASWSLPSVITTDAYGVSDNFDMSAAGTHAYLAYTDKNSTYPAWGAVRYRRTLDSGANWSSELNLAPPAWKTEFPDISLQAGVVRAAYERRLNGLYYQQSSNGLGWSAPEAFDSGGFSPSVTRAGNVIVLFTVGTGDANVRTGT